MTVAEVKEQFQSSVEEGSAYFGLTTRLDDSRYCRWNGQSDDGRKYSKFLKKAAFPWEGASDIRPYYVDNIINDDVDIMRAADKNCHMQTLAANSQNDDLARATTSVLDYIARTLLVEELDRERDLAAQWRQHYGSSVLGIDWLYEEDTEIATVTTQDLMQIAQQDPQFGALLQYLVQNMQRLSGDDLAAATQAFQQYFPSVDPRAAFQQLMQTGQFQYPKKYVRTNRPCVTAYRTYQDIFFFRTTFDIQRAPWVVRRDVLSKPQVEDRSKQEQWSPKFTKFILNTGGGSVIWQMSKDTTSRYNDRIYIDEMQNLHEVFYGFYRGESPTGSRETQVCIFHPGTDEIGRQLPLPYYHGKYPFVLCRRENRSRSVLESRGVGDIADTAQAEIKTQRDSRNDRTSISTIPPLLVPLGRGKQQYKLGPASQLGVLRPGEIGWLNPPPMDNTSFDTENSIRRDTADYFGKNQEGVDPNKILRRTQRLIDCWLGENREVFIQIFQLCQQYFPPDQWVQISGCPDLVMPTDRETIQNNLRLVMEYDARDLNMEYLTEKMNLITTVLAQTDKAGVLDWAGLTQYATRALDPALAQRIIRPQAMVTQQQVTEEQDAMSQIVTGIEPPIPEGNQSNPQLALQVIQNSLQAQDFVNFVRANPLAQERLDRRIKAYQFQIQQQQNAQIGKLGVAPSPVQTATGT
jgi:hypothetical protein